MEGVRRFKVAIGDAPLVVIGQVPTTNGINLPDVMTRPFVPARSTYATTQLPEGFDTFNAALRREAERSQAFRFLDPTEFLCNEGRVCRSLDGQNQPLYSDATHLSKLGSRVLVSKFIQRYGYGVFSDTGVESLPLEEYRVRVSARS